jgi:hypothetical protein
VKAALLYAKRFGWRILPVHSVRADGLCTCGHTETAPQVCECGEPKCKRIHSPGSIGKHPRLSDWTAKATDTADTITEWFARWPEANVGVATGAGSGFWILDVDPRNGGLDSLAKLIAAHGPLPATTEAGTGSGGSHYFFKEDPAHPVGCTKIGPGLDIKGNGGQIVLAPSRSGAGSYRWVRAPWDTSIAPAPAWLAALTKRGPIPEAGPATRGYFPPASPAVLEAAADALEAHGPAVDGDGGGLHTVHGAAILTHDFALTDDEALPLFLEWNRSCVPPWEPDELAERLRRGRKYGKHPYGCRRSMDAVEAARKAVRDWQVRGDTDPQALIVAVRPLAAISGDATRHALIAKELMEATGLKLRELGLPKPVLPPQPVKQGEIQVTVKLNRVADEALTSLIPYVFARNGALCEVITAERTFISDLGVSRILYYMNDAASYVRQDEAKGLVTQSAPEIVARMLHERAPRPGIRVLEAVTSAPVFLADGSILHQRGYNPEARVFLEPSVSVDVPEHPTRADAVAAVALFRDLMGDFRFSTPADFSSWLSIVLSPLVKSATRNAPGPLVLISASSAGAGKSKLADMASIIVTGAKSEIRPYTPNDEVEWAKKITAYVGAGAPLGVFDNVVGQIGDAGLDRLITSSTWSDRRLGVSEAPPLPNVTTWVATGNNIEPRGDTVRRVLVVRLEVKEEHPQSRTGFKRPALEQHTLAHRAELLGAALTILRAFHLAGRPTVGLETWGSFEDWSALVRGALVWAGCADPFETQKRASSELNEGDTDAHDLWLEAVSSTDGSPAAIVLAAGRLGVQERLGLREPLTVHGLRRLIARWIDKPRMGRCIRRVRDGAGVRYRVTSV